MSLSSYYQKKALIYEVSVFRLTKIQELIPKTKSRILDLGCGTGALGKILKENGHDVEGWDISRPALKKAAFYLDKVRQCNLESDQWPNTPQKFDLIICSEVIEHLFDPEKVLRKIRSDLLKPNGKLILSTPNFVHFVNRVKILLGIFEYQNKGLLDHSHIHFFTRKSLRDLAFRVGFKIVRENNLYTLNIPDIIGKIFPSLFAYQLVFLLKKNGKH